jgi:hypothetical protein
MLRADCARCAALCCVGLAFDRSHLFAFDKAPGAPCRLLNSAGRCRIHDRLSQEGFEGCARYDCLGAGQYVVQQIFAGRSWRTEPDLVKPMLESFAILCEVHELLLLLLTAKKLSLAPSQLRAVDAFLAALQPRDHWTIESLHGFAKSGTAAAVRSFLTTLRANAAVWASRRNSAEAGVGGA